MIFEKFFNETEYIFNNATGCFDSQLLIIDDKDYYGHDFSEDNRVFMLAYWGASNYFPGIIIGDHKEGDWDKLPVYTFDLCERSFSHNGNFKTYFSDYAMELMSDGDITLSSYNIITKALNAFSDILLKDP